MRCSLENTISGVIRNYEGMTPWQEGNPGYEDRVMCESSHTGSCPVLVHASEPRWALKEQLSPILSVWHTHTNTPIYYIYISPTFHLIILDINFHQLVFKSVDITWEKVLAVVGKQNSFYQCLILSFLFFLMARGNGRQMRL